MKSFPELITTTLNLGGNAVLKVFDRTPTMPNNESRRRELESISGLYGDDLLQTIDVYANQSYRILNQEIEKIGEDIHHEVVPIHHTLRKRLQVLSDSVKDMTERAHNHSVSALKLQQSVEESYIEFDNLTELREKVSDLQTQIQIDTKKIKDYKASLVQDDFNDLLDDITSTSPKKNKAKQPLDKLTLFELRFKQLRLRYLQSVFKIRTSDKKLVNMRLELEERKELSRPYANWTAEKLEEQKLQMKPKLQDLQQQLSKLKHKYAEADRRSSMYRLEQESLEKDLVKYQAVLNNTDEELRIHQDENALESEQKKFTTVVTELISINKAIDRKIEIVTQQLAMLVVNIYKGNIHKGDQRDGENLSDYFFAGCIATKDISRLRQIFDLLQRVEALRLRNQQHILRLDIWFNERKIRKLNKELKEHKKLGADRGSFIAATKESKQDIEKRSLKINESLHKIFQTHLELLLERHKQPKECLQTSQFAFEQACSKQELDFESFKKDMWDTVGSSQFEKEEGSEDKTRRTVIESCIQTKQSVISACKFLRAKHAEVLLVASQTPNLAHTSGNMIKRRQRIQECRKKLHKIKLEVSEVLND